MAGWFAPRTRLGLELRRLTTNLMDLPGLGPWLLRRMFFAGGGLAAYPD